jgi:hypothetical protein
MICTLLVTFITGVVIGATAFPVKTSLNEGLATAWSSVGKNLFGDLMFDASVKHPPDPVEPELQIDFALYPPDPVFPTLFPKRVNFAYFPLDPIDTSCRVGLQINIAADGAISGIIDPDILPQFDLQYTEVPITGAFCDNSAIIVEPPG